MRMNLFDSDICCNRDSHHSVEYVDVDINSVIHSTDGATLFDMGDGLEKWIPKSVYRETGEEHLIQVARWFAEKEGLI